MFGSDSATGGISYGIVGATAIMFPREFFLVIYYIGRVGHAGRAWGNRRDRPQAMARVKRSGAWVARGFPVDIDYHDTDELIHQKLSVGYEAAKAWALETLET